MAQHSHVPKFGNWDRENVPYTTYFENARKDRSASGAKMFNPNDPEQNPDAFMYESSNYETHNPPVRAPPFRITSDKGVPALKHQHKNQANKEYGEFSGFMESPTHHNTAFPKANLEAPRRSYKNSVSDGSIEKSISQDYSKSSSQENSLSIHGYPMGSGNKAGMSSSSWTRKNSPESTHSVYPSTPGRSKLRGGNNRGDETPGRGAAVPKFGAWNESDPTSGEGFTMIFNKVKEEKRNGANRFPTIPNEPMIYSNSHNSHNNSSQRRSICCCLSPRVNE